jgi:hypothetical protein
VSDLKDLLERVEGAEGPDRVLDAAVYYAVAKALHRRGGYVSAKTPMVAITDDGRMWAALPAKERRGGPQSWHGAGFAPPYTASLDAALALVERVQPGTKKAISHRNFQYDGWLVTLVPPEGLAQQGRSQHLALALLAALLKSLSKEDKT